MEPRPCSSKKSKYTGRHGRATSAPIDIVVNQMMLSAGQHLVELPLNLLLVCGQIIQGALELFKLLTGGTEFPFCGQALVVREVFCGL